MNLNERLLNGGFTATLLLFAGLVVLTPKPSVKEELAKDVPSSRLHTLHKIAEEANRGNYFQIDDAIPMEKEWEDPGMGVTLSLMGLVRRPLPAPYDRVEVSEIFFVEAALILMFLLLPFTPLFRHLPGWYGLVPPVFLLVCVAGRFLNFSWGLHWVSPLSTLWVVTAQVNFLYYFRSAEKTRADRVLIALNAAAVGVGIGFLGLFRRNVFAESLLLTAATPALVVLIPRVARLARRGLSARFAGALVVALVLGALLPKWTVNGLWWARDRHQTMHEVPRNPGHPFWHVMYIALGYVSNDKNIKWWDETGYEHARAVDPTVVYGSRDYEIFMRGMFLKEIARRPMLLVRNVLAKFIETFSFYRYLPLVPIFFFLVLALTRWEFSVFGAVGALNAAIWSSGPVLVYPEREYALSLYTGVALWTLIIFLVLVFDKEIRSAAIGAAKSSSARIAMAVSTILIALPFLGYLAFYGSITRDAGLFWLRLQSNRGDIIETDIRVDKETKRFDFHLPAGADPVTMLHLKPWYYFKSPVRIQEIQFFDANGNLVIAADPSDSAQWTSYNVRFIPENQEAVVSPRHANFAVRWRPSAPFSATSMTIVIGTES